MTPPVMPCRTDQGKSRRTATYQPVDAKTPDPPYFAVQVATLPLISAAAPFHTGGRGGPGNYTLIPPDRRLSAPAGSAMTFQPEATGHIADLSPMLATALDLTPGRFRRLRLHP